MIYNISQLLSGPSEAEEEEESAVQLVSVVRQLLSGPLQLLGPSEEEEEEGSQLPSGPRPLHLRSGSPSMLMRLFAVTLRGKGRGSPRLDGGHGAR
jgi:hypothetical protein